MSFSSRFWSFYGTKHQQAGCKQGLSRTHLFIVVVVATASLHQYVEFTLGLEHLSFSLSTFLHMPLDKIVRLLVEELESGKNLS
jgi:hypothetical protein